MKTLKELAKLDFSECEEYENGYGDALTDVLGVINRWWRKYFLTKDVAFEELKREITG